MNWGKVVEVLLLIYRALLSGRTVNIGGTPVVLPSQKGSIPVVR